MMQSSYLAQASALTNRGRTPAIIAAHHRSNELFIKSDSAVANRRCMSNSHTRSSRELAPLVMHASSASAEVVDTTPAPSRKGLEYTTHEGNSWMAAFRASGVKVLVDPWLVDNLVFAESDWLYKGVKRVFKPGQEAVDHIAAETDVILLTMSLPDHSHRPTLKALPKSLPVVASPSAATVARELGFATVHQLDHGQAITMCNGKLTLTATAGALVGPPWSKRENGYVMTENVDGGIKLYYEPHCDYDEGSLQGVGPVDVVVSPPSNQELAGLYPLVKGNTDNERLIELLKPQVVIALCNAEFDAIGLLNAIIVEKGGVGPLRQQLQPYDVEVLAPAPAGIALQVNL